MRSYRYHFEGLPPYLGDVRLAPLVLNLQVALTPNETRQYVIACPAEHPGFFDRANILVTTPPVDADGAITARLKKYDKSAASYVLLTEDVNLETLVANEAVAFAEVANLTDDQTFMESDGDFLVLEVTSNSAAIDTQPANLTVTAWMAVKA